MNHQEFKEKIPLLISGELNEAEKQELNEHLENCKECKSEYNEFLEMEDVFKEVTFIDPDEQLMKEYWSNLYNKMEKKTGVIFTSIGVVIGLFILLVWFFKDFLFNVNEPFPLRLGAGVLIAGVVILVVSVVREQFFYYKRERYKEVSK